MPRLISTAGPFDTDWHLHVGTIEAKAATRGLHFGGMVIPWKWIHLLQ